MLQGGDPTGTGKGGKSYWGSHFDDEFNLRNARSSISSSFLSQY